MRLFTAHPEYMKYFSNFSDVPLDQLRTFARFRRHGLNVARSLDQAIGELNDVPKLVDRFTALGVTHGGRKISEQAFQILVPKNSRSPDSYLVILL
ncbi:uncharacterized protein LOC113372798 [Ctenocephalides felis]|uniref:uncharacterized protein LOC113372798 n=1 Tax=Ctenocephalides felis TaxID=7515 RepID=UPI000E6E37A2|nr:uncharacterized protein LOC113372798 [Ctenocephalides felis]